MEAEEGEGEGGETSAMEERKSRGRARFKANAILDIRFPVRSLFRIDRSFFSRSFRASFRWLPARRFRPRIIPLLPPPVTASGNFLPRVFLTEKRARWRKRQDDVQNGETEKGQRGRKVPGGGGMLAHVNFLMFPLRYRKRPRVPGLSISAAMPGNWTREEKRITGNIRNSSFSITVPTITVVISLESGVAVPSWKRGEFINLKFEFINWIFFLRSKMLTEIHQLDRSCYQLSWYRSRFILPCWLVIRWMSSIERYFQCLKSGMDLVYNVRGTHK